MNNECKNLIKSYKALFKETMNPVFFTMYSYIANTKTPILLEDLEKDNEITL